jgi:hypothetical protein
MFAPTQLRMVALAVSVTAALTTAPASAQTQPHDDDFALPLTPPSLESANPLYERTPTAPRPAGAAGFALLALMAGPVGFALGGFGSAAAPENIASPLPTLELPVLAPTVPAPATGVSR